MIEFGAFFRPRGITPELAAAFPVISDVLDSFGYNCRLTHACDGTHSRASLHYAGNAVDIVWLPYDTFDHSEIADDLYKKLNGFPKSAGLEADYDVVYERTHIHVEYQPKLDDTAYKKQVDKFLYGG